MVETWFAIFWAMVTAYVILDGRNFGAAMLRLVVASNAAERQQVLDAIGPLWTWHEVWLVAAGGVLLLAFPAMLATAFAGFYLALFLVLWLLILRGVSLEVGGHVANPLWQSFRDVVLTASSALLALLLGLALGNLLRGVPLEAGGDFHLALFTDFAARGDVGLIDWYTLSVAALGLAVFAAHGATYLVLKTEGPVRDRSRVAAQRLWIVGAALGIVVAAETSAVRPDLVSGFGSRPLLLVFVATGISGGAAILSGLRARRDGRAFAGSCILIAGALAVHAAASFPVMLHSTLDAEGSLTAYQAAARRESLGVALAWWTAATPLAVLWAVLVGRFFRGRVGPERPAA